MKPNTVRDLLVSLGLTAGLGSSLVACGSGSTQIGNPPPTQDGAAGGSTDAGDAAGGSGGAGGAGGKGGAGTAGFGGAAGSATGGAGGMAGWLGTSNPPPPDGSWGLVDTGVDTPTDAVSHETDGNVDAATPDGKDGGG